MSRYKYSISNLECANCANKIEKEMNKSKYFENAIINFSTSTLSYTASINNHQEEALKIIQNIEPDITLAKEQINTTFNLNKSHFILLLLGIFLGMFSFFFTGPIKNILILLSYLLLLTKVAFKAVKILFNNKSLDENMLITISVVGAYLIGDGFEGFMVIALYTSGKLLESIAVNKSRKNISTLMNIKTKYANVLENNLLRKKDPRDVNVNDIIIVKVGEKIPLDGIIIKGKTHLNMAALTGESIPVAKNLGDNVLSGTVNLTEKIEVKVTSLYENSTVSRILDLIENASNKKAKTENFISKAAKVYTPIIIALSLTSCFFLPLFGVNASTTIYRSLSFLVISCPCAIAISVPLCYFSGIGIASKYGILIKGSNYLDNLQNISTIIFDKTGTLTTGKFKVSEIKIFNKKYQKEDILKLCALGESFSNHPISSAILSSFKKNIDQSEIKNHKEIPGKGISFEYKKDQYKIGNSVFVKAKDESEGTSVYLAKNNLIIGKIIIEDELKTSTISALQKLKKMGINIIMLTGDKENVAQKIAKKCDINEYYAELLPQDKFHIVEEKLKTKQGILASVGDGINDAPILALSDIGISMGLIGSSAAIEASDVVIMTDQLEKIVHGITISKYTSRIIKQNLIFSIGIKLIFIILNLLGQSTMALAVFADVGVTILAIFNSLRILHQKIN